MKKTYNYKIGIFSILLVICLFVFNLGCGMDVYYVLGSPSQIGGIPDQNIQEYQYKKFEFRTNEEASLPGGLMILGTDVYYKIYDNIDSLINDVSYINNSEGNTSSVDKLLSSGRNYALLKGKNLTNSVLIPYTQKNRTVFIRLTDYLELDDYAARITVDGDNLNGSPARVVPVRNVSDSTGFNFGKENPNERKPVSTDRDANITSSSSEGFYYVSMYALTVAHDALFRNFYSEPIYLGCVKIDSNNPDMN